jgi:electron transport complex protein RnfE
VIASAADGLFMGLGFTIALTLMGAFREILGSGMIFGVKLWDFQIAFFSSSAGSFFTFGIFIGIFSLIDSLINKHQKVKLLNKTQGKCLCSQSDKQDKEAK